MWPLFEHDPRPERNGQVEHCLRPLSWPQLPSKRSSPACKSFLLWNSQDNYQVLGRATEISSFVKDQKKEGYIELELKGKMGTPNLTIRRQIFSDKKSSTFTLNGTAATGKEVSEKITELNIQVANLWSVLLFLETVSTLIASTVRFSRRTRSPSLPG
jgi:hypothetical protein